MGIMTTGMVDSRLPIFSPLDGSGLCCPYVRTKYVRVYSSKKWRIGSLAEAGKLMIPRKRSPFRCDAGEC